MSKKKKTGLTIAFLLVQALLYWLILTSGGEVLRWSEFGAIVLCAAFALYHSKYGNKWLVAGLVCTVMADFWLVAWKPQQQFWGMVFFLAAQICYAVAIHRSKSSRKLLWARIGLVAVAELVVVLVLGSKTDLLALVSLAYYVMLILNMLGAYSTGKWMFGLALTMFLVCDTVIGLQVAAGGYLPIPEGSILHQIISTSFNLAWLFYLPSQVFIALNAKRRKLK